MEIEKTTFDSLIKQIEDLTKRIEQLENFNENLDNNMSYNFEPLRPFEQNWDLHENIKTT